MSFFISRLLRVDSAKVIIIVTAITALLSCEAVISLTTLITVHPKVDIHNFLIIFLHLSLFFRAYTAAYLLIEYPADSSIRAILSGCGFHLRRIV